MTGIFPAPGEIDRWIDDGEALALVEELMAIPGKSGEELQVAERVRERLQEVGVPEKAVLFDQVHRRSRLGGQCGNLICHWPASLAGPRRLFAAHLDTVPLCEGSRPERRGGRFRSAVAGRALGADNRSGVAVLLTVARTLARHNLRTMPLSFCWFVQEEVGLEGSRHVSLATLRRPRLAFNWDGGSAEKLTIGATGAYRMEIEILGRASHAGNAPEKGVSALVVAGQAIAQLAHSGWHGKIVQQDGEGTSNIGVLQAGEATNVVAPYARLSAEARSHDPRFRRKIVRQFRQAFRQAAQAVQSADGRRARIRWKERLDYESFLLDKDEVVVQTAVEAVRHLGGEPQLAVARGGLDANWLVRHGLPTITLGCGQIHPHTPQEQLDIREYLRACRIALALALWRPPGRNR
ncbi:MAG: peptidase M20 [Pirellulaceae bacterium]|nr:MAG: peptidase M20 [Pirellulaceae bacterium]